MRKVVLAKTGPPDQSSGGAFYQPNRSTQDHVWQPEVVIAICLHGYFTELVTTGFLICLK